MFKPYILTVSSEKGGVGKTTLATNLAIYLKALAEDLPVTVLSFDNHFTVDRMFRIGNTLPKGDVSDLFTGRGPEALVETGEYGVQFIPSSRKLTEIRDSLKEVDALGRLLASSPLEGVVIIDTRPDLDILTRNALFAADRVIIPVKDAPSLENCRNIYDFFQEQGLSRKDLRILPCLIDARIRFDGPFRDSYRLLKGYAINRGYRCLEGYIAKSPKVESLNTNPEGKIYPVITHGRGTEVHIQFAHLARQVYLGAKEKPDRRLDDIRRSLSVKQEEREDAFSKRREHLAPVCLICGKNLVTSDAVAPAGYYAETSDGRIAGFLEEECFSGAIFSQFYRTRREIDPTDAVRDLFRESSHRSYFVLRRAPNTRNFYQQQISFYRFDENGLEVSHKVVDLKTFQPRFLNRDPSGLYQLIERTLLDVEGKLDDAFLLVRRTSTDFPEEILYSEEYGNFRKIAEKISAQLP